MSTVNVQDLQVTSEEVLVRNKVISRGHYDADVTERCLFDHSVVVRTDIQPKINFVAQNYIGHLKRYERLAEMRDRHDIQVAFSFQLNDVRACERKSFFLGRSTGRSSELKRCKTITMNPCIDVESARIKV